MQIFALLPIITFLGLFVRLIRIPTGSQIQFRDLTLAFVMSTTLWGVCVVLSIELLSVFHGIFRLPIILFWLGSLLLICYRGNLVERSRILAGCLKQAVRSLDLVDWILLSFIGAVVFLEFLVAIISPPNNVDSLLYHMSRVVHWIQNRTISHYPTAYGHQLFMPIWAESAILHLRVLYGSDRLVNLIQWFSFLGTTIVVATIADLLGFSRKMQIAAAVVVVTIPMALLQSSSTQNDLVVAYWLCCLAFLMLRNTLEGFSPLYLVFIGAVAGLGMLTKITFYVYAFPAGIAFLWLAQRNSTPRQFALRLGIPLAIILGINLGYWSRNLKTYGTLFGPKELVQAYAFIDIGEIQEPGEGQPTDDPEEGTGPEDVQQKVSGLNIVLSKIKEMALWNMAVPLSPFRDRSSVVDNFLVHLLDDNQYVSLDYVLWNHEDTAGNPLHFILIGVAFLSLLLPQVRSGFSTEYMIYAGLLLASYLLLPILISNAFSIDGVRFQLPFFIMAAPLGMGLIRSIPWPVLRGLVIAGLIISCIPWLLFNNTRPLVGWKPSVTRVDSIFLAPSTDLIFAMSQGSQDEYQAIIDEISVRTCENIGIVLDSHDYEYLLWYLLEAPQSGIRIMSLESSPRLIQYRDTSYQPCAVICTICQGHTRYDGMDLVSDYGSIALFMPR